MYDWMLTFAHSPYATLALFVFSFTEAIFFPIPPFVLQIPLTLERRERAWYYAGVCSLASVVGGVVGYLLGASFHGLATKLFTEAALHKLDEYTANPWLLTVAAIAVHPYKLFTIAAGFLGVSMGAFLLASAVARSVLFFGIGLLLWLFGPPVRVFIDRYFNLLTIVFGVLVVAILVLAKSF
jgi:membrane protein YqaA with SNARE-associated domain